MCTASLTRRRRWHPTPVLLPGKSHGRRSLMGCSPWGPEELDTTEQLPFHFSLSHIGEGNGNPLQCSCLENPRDSRAWWAAIYGVAQSRTRLKWLSSSSKSYWLSSCPQLNHKFPPEVHFWTPMLRGLERDLPRAVELMDSRLETDPSPDSGPVFRLQH